MKKADGSRNPYTTAEVGMGSDYSAEELEFLTAMQEYQLSQSACSRPGTPGENGVSDTPIYFCGTAEALVNGPSQRRSNQAKWWLAGTLAGIDPAALKRAVQAAFDSWSAVANVVASEALSLAEADLVLSTGVIDGPGRILAQCELPGPPVQHAWVDTGDRWVIHLGSDVPQGFIDLCRVLAHELGHFWGLSHSPIGSGNLMDPIYSLSVDGPRAGDAQEMVGRYGPAVVRPPPTPPPSGTGLPATMAIFDDQGKETARFKLTRV